MSDLNQVENIYIYTCVFIQKLLEILQNRSTETMEKLLCRFFFSEVQRVVF